jgi:pimeloyl-ACP methyl ester carboxylesterase
MQYLLARFLFMQSPFFTRSILRLLTLGSAALLATDAAHALKLASCEIKPPGVTYELKAECGSFEAPLDRAAPNGAKLSIAVAKIASRAREPKADPMVFLAGGPGQSAKQSFVPLQLGFADILRHRDVWLIDQRGTGESALLSCAQDDKTPLTELLANPPDRAAGLAVLKRCAERLGEAAKHYTTLDYIADLEQFRVAQGIQQWNLYGGSYGTRVALAYAKYFPKSIRSVIVDGVVASTEPLGSSHGKNAQTALKSLSDRCAADAKCNAAFPDVYANAVRLLSQLEATPVDVQVRMPGTHRAQKVRLTRDSFASTVRLLLYGPETQPLLPLLLHEAAQGDFAPITRVGLMTAESLMQSLNSNVELSILCSEDFPVFPPIKSEPDWLLRDMQQNIADTCTFWPRGARKADFHVPDRGSIPTLLLSGEFDPVTPPSFADIAKQELTNATHLVAKGQGHIVLSRACMPRIAGDFVEQLKVDPAGTKCLDQLAAPAFFIDYNGPNP